MHLKGGGLCLVTYSERGRGLLNTLGQGAGCHCKPTNELRAWTNNLIKVVSDFACMCVKLRWGNRREVEGG